MAALALAAAALPALGAAPLALRAEPPALVLGAGEGATITIDGGAAELPRVTANVGRNGQYLLDVRALLRLHGNDALNTAARDVKVDAERISMG
jgi:hypothetical protein